MVTSRGCAAAHPGFHHLHLLLRFSPTMVPLHLFLVVVSCLSLADAEPFHIPLVRRRDQLSTQSYLNAANALRYEYGATHSSPSKRQDVPVINQVCLAPFRQSPPPQQPFTVPRYQLPGCRPDRNTVRSTPFTNSHFQRFLLKLQTALNR